MIWLCPALFMAFPSGILNKAAWGKRKIRLLKWRFRLPEHILHIITHFIAGGYLPGAVYNGCLLGFG